MKSPLRIAITTGDVDGIGTEIVSKALVRLKPKSGVIFYLWRSPSMPSNHLKKIDAVFERLTVNSWPDALRVTPSSHKQIVDICSTLSPARWVEIAAEACTFHYLDGIATAPLSKTTIAASGLTDLGHTDILQRVSKSKYCFMAFVGHKFNVLLATGHIPLKSTSAELTTEQLMQAFHAASSLRTLLKTPQKLKPMALLGFNPHAGEQGLIGKEELETMIPCLQAAQKQLLNVEGPLVPDTAFFTENLKRYSIFICPYHDQGLIPFKMAHGHDANVHLTMGLPFVRTSVDHGTAKNIFGKNKADSRSMEQALLWAINLGKQRKR